MTMIVRHRPPLTPTRSQRFLVGAVAASTLLFTAACTADTPEEGSDVTARIGEPAVVERPSTTTSATTATSSTVSVTTTSIVPPGLPAPDQAADALYAAWKAGDRQAAAAVAEPTAVDQIFAAAPGDYALYNKCNTGEFGQSSCLFRGDAGTIQFNMRQHGATWVVSMAVFSPA